MREGGGVGAGSATAVLGLHDDAPPVGPAEAVLGEGRRHFASHRH